MKKDSQYTLSVQYMHKYSITSCASFNAIVETVMIAYNGINRAVFQSVKTVSVTVWLVQTPENILIYSNLSYPDLRDTGTSLYRGSFSDFNRKFKKKVTFRPKTVNFGNAQISEMIK